MGASSASELAGMIVGYVLVLWLFVIYWIAAVRILHRLGYSGWWSLVSLLPIINIIALWRFSKAAWPATTSVARSN